jgi:RNA polymerase sigma factor for flagellar operon FliA
MSIVPDDPDLAMHWTRWLQRKNAASREHLIVHYSPLVKFVAGRVGAGLPNSVDPGDLVSAGVFGLIDAVERFDSGRGVKFETFAVPRIRGAVFDGLRSLDWVPRSVRSRAREVEGAQLELAHLSLRRQRLLCRINLQADLVRIDIDCGTAVLLRQQRHRVDRKHKQD